jgi:hypothetical protein
MRIPRWVSLVLIAIVVFSVVGMFSREGFSVPVFPSAEQDKKLVTPAGNVITY